MGQFLFDVPDSASEFFGSCLWQDAYVCGIEGVPWQCHNRFEAQKLTVSRSIDSSGKLHLTCPVADVGYRTLSTCSLRPGSMVYSLPLELARGCCYRCRVQADAWQRAGLTLNEEFEDLLAKGT
ncbi:MAG: glycoside hydrolase family 10, partial [Planctomycetota bacterium]